MNIVESLEAKHIEELIKDKKIPEFRSGDTVKVNVRIKDCLLYTSPSPRDSV